MGDVNGDGDGNGNRDGDANGDSDGNGLDVVDGTNDGTDEQASGGRNIMTGRTTEPTGEENWLRGKMTRGRDTGRM